MLYFESTFKLDKQLPASEKFHSTTKDAAQIAKEAGVKQLVLTHYSAQPKRDVAKKSDQQATAGPKWHSKSHPIRFTQVRQQTGNPAAP